MLPLSTTITVHSFHLSVQKPTVLTDIFVFCIYNHRTTKTNQKYPSVNL